MRSRESEKDIKIPSPDVLRYWSGMFTNRGGTFVSGRYKDIHLTSENVHHGLRMTIRGLTPDYYQLLDEDFGVNCSKEDMWGVDGKPALQIATRIAPYMYGTTLPPEVEARIRLVTNNHDPDIPITPIGQKLTIPDDYYFISGLLETKLSEIKGRGLGISGLWLDPTLATELYNLFGGIKSPTENGKTKWRIIGNKALDMMTVLSSFFRVQFLDKDGGFSKELKPGVFDFNDVMQKFLSSTFPQKEIIWNYQQQLEELLREGKGVNEVLRLATKYLSLPLLIQDVNEKGSIIASTYAGNSGVNADVLENGNNKKQDKNPEVIINQLHEGGEALISVDIPVEQSEELRLKTVTPGMPSLYSLSMLITTANAISNELSISERVKAETDPHRESDTVRELFTQPPEEVNRVLIRTSRQTRQMDLRQPHLVLAFPDGIDKGRMSEETFNGRILWSLVDGFLPSGEQIEQHVGVVTPLKSRDRIRPWAQRIAATLSTEAIGIAEVAQNFQQIRERFYQAVIAATLGPELAKERMIPSSPVYFFDSLGIYRQMAYADPDRLESEMNELFTMLLGGRSNPESFLSTYQGLIRDRQTIQGTARQNAFHPNTLQHHLEALEKVKKLTIDDGPDTYFSRHDPIDLDTISFALRAQLATKAFAKARSLCDIEHPAEFKGFRRVRSH